MKRQLAPLALVTMFVCGLGSTIHAEKITLQEALKRAQAHPQLAIANAERTAAQGRRQQAGTITYNPELSGGLGPRLGGNQTTLDFELGVSQTFELGDERRHRQAASAAMAVVAKANETLVKQQVRLGVRRSFALALAAQRILETTRAAESLASDLKRTADERLERGAGTLLEVNLAAAGVGRAKRRRSEAEQELIAAEYLLASAVGSTKPTRLQAIGEAEVHRPRLPSVDELIRQGLAARADLQVLEAHRDAAQAEVGVADGLAIPNLSLGASYAHEDSSEQILATVRIEIPLWNRNAGGRNAARANRERARLTLDYGKRELRRQVHAALASYLAARKTVEDFDAETVGKLEETLALTREAFERGKISMLEFNLLRSEFVDAQLAYLEAVKAEIQARYDLEQAIGGELTP